MKHIVFALAIAVVLAGVGYWYSISKMPATQEADANDSEKGEITAAPSERNDNVKSPFVVNNTKDSTSTADVVPDNTKDEGATERSADRKLPPDWGAELSDEEFNNLVAVLKADASLFQQLIDDFRQETDSARKQRLAILLGAVGGDEITGLASELIFSGDSESRALGLQLLQDVQPGNAQARDIVSGLLSTEVQPEILKDALSVIAKPGVADAQSRATMSDQVALLTKHEDDGVRSISLDILSRWSQDGRYTDTFLAGLDDQSEYVRASAAYSLANHEDPSPVAIERLFGLVRDAEELKTVKRAAVLALRSMPLAESQLVELAALEKQMNTKPR